MKKPHVINIFVSIILIFAGLFSYFTNEARPMTALLAPALGVIFLLLTPAIIKGSRTIAHLIVVLTFIFGIMTAAMAYSTNASGNKYDVETRVRRVTVFSIMSAGCLIGTVLYIAGFIDRKKEMKRQAGGGI